MTDDKAKKERSPSFPFISLEKAVGRARALHEGHRREAARLTAVAPTWGYGTKSSGLLQTVAALKQFGLLEDFGSGEDRKVQLSELGRRILIDERPGAKEAALKEAAKRPRLIGEYIDRWVPDRPSDSHCISELQFDRGFTSDAARLFLKVFDDTVSYAELGDSDSLSHNPNSDEESEPVHTQPEVQQAAPPPARDVYQKLDEAFFHTQLPFSRRYQFGMSNGTLELKATIRSPAEIDKLVKMLEGQKAALEAMADADEVPDDVKDLLG